MNVIHLLPSLMLYGGTPKKIKDLIKKSIHNHYIYCTGCPEGKSNYQEYKNIFLRNRTVGIFDGFYNYDYLKHAYCLSLIIRQNSIKIIHTYFPHEILIAALVKVINPRIELINSFVGIQDEKQRMKDFLINISLILFKQHIAISHFVKQNKIHMYSSVKRNVPLVIYNGTDLFRKNSSSTEQKYHSDLLFVGGLNVKKNVKFLIKVVYLVKTYFSNILLLIIGDGFLRLEIEKMILELNLEANVKILGYQLEIDDYFTNSKIYVHPSRVEGFGISVLEAMLFGKAIIAANSGALPELIVHKKSGLLVDPFDETQWTLSIVELLKNEDYRKCLGKEAKSRADSVFSFNKFVRKHDALYNLLGD